MVRQKQNAFRSRNGMLLPVTHGTVSSFIFFMELLLPWAPPQSPEDVFESAFFWAGGSVSTHSISGIVACLFSCPEQRCAFRKEGTAEKRKCVPRSRIFTSAWKNQPLYGIKMIVNPCKKRKNICTCEKNHWRALLLSLHDRQKIALTGAARHRFPKDRRLGLCIRCLKV